MPGHANAILLASRRFLVLFLLAGVPACAQIEKSIGVLRTQEATGCLMIRNDSLQPGTPIAILRNVFNAEPPAKGLKVGKKLLADCTNPPGGFSETSATFYEVQIPKTLKATNGANGVVYAGDNARPASQGWLIEGKPIAIRECASSEGLHLTAWSGKPLASERLWHFYYYLDVDMESNCTARDTAQ